MLNSNIKNFLNIAFLINCHYWFTTKIENVTLVSANFDREIIEIQRIVMRSLVDAVFVVLHVAVVFPVIVVAPESSFVLLHIPEFFVAVAVPVVCVTVPKLVDALVPVFFHFAPADLAVLFSIADFVHVVDFHLDVFH